MPDFPNELVEAAQEAIYAQIDAEYLPFMARVRDFTREEVLAGKLREADEEAARQNLEWCGELARSALAAVLPRIESDEAVERAAWALFPDHPEPMSSEGFLCARRALRAAIYQHEPRP